MAAYRQVFVSFWQDAFVLDLTPEEKYFYVYLMTNGKTSQCGIYELPLRVIEMDTGYNRETVEKLLERFISYGKILYCKETKEIMILNWLKYNLVNSPKVKSCMRKELLEVKNKEFIKKLVEILKEQNITEDIQWIPYANPIDTIEISKESTKDTISIPNIYPLDNTSIDYGEKEKEKDKEKQKEYKKEKQKDKEKEKEEQVQRIKQEVEVEIKELELKEKEEEKALLNKENYKAINKATEKQEQRKIESQSVSLLNYFENLTGHIGGLNLSALKTAVKDHGEENVKKAIDKALEKNKPTMIYINGILKNWAVEGYPSERDGIRYGGFKGLNRSNEGKYSGFKPQEPRTLTEEERREIEAELL